MGALIQKLHPALRLHRGLVLASSGAPVFSRQGNWDGGSTLHCAAMALALLGKLADPVDVWLHSDGPEAHFWDRAWPHYLHGLTLEELGTFLWELNCGLRPVIGRGNPVAVLRFCTGNLARMWPVIVGWRSHHPVRAHAALAIGVEGRQYPRGFVPHALLLLDPAVSEPKMAGFNARLEFGRRKQPFFVTTGSAYPVVIEGAVSIGLGQPP